jgi:hypothetical protein
VIQCRAGAELSVFADHARLDRAAIDESDDAGNDTSEREVNV